MAHWVWVSYAIMLDSIAALSIAALCAKRFGKQSQHTALHVLGKQVETCCYSRCRDARGGGAAAVGAVRQREGGVACDRPGRPCQVDIGGGAADRDGRLGAGEGLGGLARASQNPVEPVQQVARGRRTHTFFLLLCVLCGQGCKATFLWGTCIACGTVSRSAECHARAFGVAAGAVGAVQRHRCVLRCRGIYRIGPGGAGRRQRRHAKVGERGGRCVFESRHQCVGVQWAGDDDPGHWLFWGKIPAH